MNNNHQEWKNICANAPGMVSNAVIETDHKLMMNCGGAEVFLFKQLISVITLQFIFFF